MGMKAAAASLRIQERLKKDLLNSNLPLNSKLTMIFKEPIRKSELTNKFIHRISQRVMRLRERQFQAKDAYC